MSRTSWDSFTGERLGFLALSGLCRAGDRVCCWSGWSVPMSDGVWSDSFVAHHTGDPHAPPAHTPRTSTHSVSVVLQALPCLSFPVCRVSVLLSVVCLPCLLSVLFCFCLAFVFCLSILFLSFLRLSVCPSVCVYLSLTVAVGVCLCLSSSVCLSASVFVSICFYRFCFFLSLFC